MKTHICPTCGATCKKLYSNNGDVERIEQIPFSEIDHYLEPMPDDIAKQVRRGRGKRKTVAIVGGAPSSSSWAPFDHEGVEIWSMNEMHARPWFKRADKWFQMHKPEYFMRDHPTNHWEWLQQEHDFPIFMQEQYADVPSCIQYPMAGNELFTSTIDYMIAYALRLSFKRIELYGVAMEQEGEWGYQREGLAYWAGKAEGLGVEIWLPPNSTLMQAPLYGYEVTRDEKGKVI